MGKRVITALTWYNYYTIMKGLVICMDTVKTRKQGNSVMVTISSKFGVPEGKTYYITQETDGTISLIPKIEDYFAEVKLNEYIDDEDDIAKYIEVESGTLDE